MSNRLIIFDVDGTLVRSFMRELNQEFDHQVDPDRKREIYDIVEVLPGRQAAINVLAAGGCHFALATNQAGAVLGFQTIPQVHEKMGRVCAALEHFRGQPYSVHIAFEHSRAKTAEYREDPLRRRKPGPGLLLEAMIRHGAAPEETLFIGDMETDQLAAEAANVKYQDAEEFFQ